MNVLFEILSNTAIENIVSSINYKFDKVIFFGFKDVIKKMEVKTYNFLSKYCNVKDISFRPLIKNDSNNIYDVISNEVKENIALGNEIFVDSTGGSDITLLILGQIVKEYNLSFHYYDLYEEKLYDINNQLDSKLEKQNIGLNIEMLLDANGEKINNFLDKANVSSIDLEFIIDLKNIWNIIKNINDFYWTKFSSILARVESIDNNAIMPLDIYNSFKANNYHILMEEFRNLGLISDISLSSKGYSFRFKNEMIKRVFLECGALLEYMVYLKRKDEFLDIKTGVHIDWDGIITPEARNDVLNEIDVLGLNNYHFIFISCKMGKMSNPDILNAMYELDSLSIRLGNKYSKKELVLKTELTEALMLRAKEMNIKIRYINEID